MGTRPPNVDIENFVQGGRRGDISEVRRLFTRHGTNIINKKDSVGFTALMAAAAFDRPEIVSFLLDAGADPVIKNLQGRTALEVAEANKSAASLKHLQKVAPPLTPAEKLHADALTGQIRQLKKLKFNLKRKP